MFKLSLLTIEIIINPGIMKKRRIKSVGADDTLLALLNYSTAACL
jgi:hypothetical protein